MNDEELNRAVQQALAPPDFDQVDDAELEAMLDSQTPDTAYGQGMLARANQKPEKKPTNKYQAIAALLFLATIPFIIVAIANHDSSEGDTKQTATGTDKPMVEIQPEFPEPVFQGTPIDIVLPNLEPAQSPRLTFTAPEGVHLISHGATVASSAEEPLIGDLKMVTDGQKVGDQTHFVELPPHHQWIQIDLGQQHDVFAIALWHYHYQMRAYRDVVIQVCAEPEFRYNSVTVYNNDHDNSLGFGAGKDPAYIETHHGRIIDIDGIPARYIRLHSNGNTEDSLNHYTEVEVYGQ